MKRLVICTLLLLCVTGLLGYFIYTQNLTEDNLFLFEMNGKYGYMSNRGKIKIKLIFYDARPFAYGLAPVKINNTDDNGWGYINTMGMVVIEPQFTGALNFYQDIAVVAYASRIPFGINKQGKRISESEFKAFNGRYQMDIKDPVNPNKTYSGPIVYSVNDMIGYEVWMVK